MIDDEALLGCRLKLLRASECLDATFSEAGKYDGAGGTSSTTPANGVRCSCGGEFTLPSAHPRNVWRGRPHIRTARDHLVWQAALLNGQTPQASNQFPIVDNLKSWSNELERGCLHGIADDVRAILERAQPYQRRDISLSGYFTDRW